MNLACFFLSVATRKSHSGSHSWLICLFTREMAEVDAFCTGLYWRLSRQRWAGLRRVREWSSSFFICFSFLFLFIICPPEVSREAGGNHSIGSRTIRRAFGSRWLPVPQIRPVQLPRDGRGSRVARILHFVADSRIWIFTRNLIFTCYREPKCLEKIVLTKITQSTGNWCFGPQ